MYLAEKTVASSAEIWAIVIVAVISLAFWLVMVVGIAPRSTAPRATRAEAREIEAQGTKETRDDLPAQPGQPESEPAAEPSVRSPLEPGTRMPAQREPATDQAAPGRRPDR